MVLLLVLLISQANAAVSPLFADVAFAGGGCGFAGTAGAVGVAAFAGADAVLLLVSRAQTVARAVWRKTLATRWASGGIRRNSIDSLARLTRYTPPSRKKAAGRQNIAISDIFGVCVGINCTGEETRTKSRLI